MELTEKKYRDTPPKNKKYVKHLTEYINYLLNKGKVLEANHYFLELESKKPEHTKTIFLGYKIAIKMFDVNRVKKYDSKLIAQRKIKKEEILHHQLLFYFSTNRIKNAQECVIELLKAKPLRKDIFDTVCEVAFKIKNYEVFSELLRYFHKNRMVPNKRSEQVFRKVLMQQLVDILSYKTK